MSAHLESLRNLISSVSPISDTEWEQFSSRWKPLNARRKEVLTVKGETERWLYFVLEGVQRVFYADDAGRDSTIVFTYAPSFGGVLDSLLLQEPSKYYYETLTTSSFLRMSASDLHELMNFPGINKFVHTGLVRSLSGVMERLAELQSYSSEEKFRTLLKRSPHILTLIPHKYIANYIGIDATNFSKLINTIKID